MEIAIIASTPRIPGQIAIITVRTFSKNNNLMFILPLCDLKKIETDIIAITRNIASNRSMDKSDTFTILTFTADFYKTPFIKSFNKFCEPTMLFSPQEFWFYNCKSSE